MNRQARFTIIHESYRKGGVNWPLVRQNIDDGFLDAIGIRVCVGDNTDELLGEHIAFARQYEIPFYTWFIPSPYLDPVWQADFYLDHDGVAESPDEEDVEPIYRGGPMVNEYQARKCKERIAQVSGRMPWYYSNYPSTTAIGNPAWIKEMFVEWAEYKYKVYPFQYKYFYEWLEKFPWWQPKWSQRLGITAGAHQLSEQGDARYYVANEKTGDPKYPNGMTKCTWP